ncbi:MAG: hypothetical protein L0H41_04800 [Microlunatus sp.]|nr:hypothetical protein [Microlunatus sp.]MDN5769333.1 hypothetical protein [Microlunatus sp.]
MRITLDIDDHVLELAKHRAASLGISVGQALSELALRGYEAEVPTAASVSGRAGDDGSFPMLSPVPGAVITDESAKAALAEDE